MVGENNGVKLFSSLTLPFTLGFTSVNLGINSYLVSRFLCVNLSCPTTTNTKPSTCRSYSGASNVHSFMNPILSWNLFSEHLNSLEPLAWLAIMKIFRLKINLQLPDKCYLIKKIWNWPQQMWSTKGFPERSERQMNWVRFKLEVRKNSTKD